MRREAALLLPWQAKPAPEGGWRRGAACPEALQCRAAGVVPYALGWRWLNGACNNVRKEWGETLENAKERPHLECDMQLDHTLLVLALLS